MHMLVVEARVFTRLPVPEWIGSSTQGTVRRTLVEEGPSKVGRKRLASYNLLRKLPISHLGSCEPHQESLKVVLHRRVALFGMNVVKP